MLGTTSISRIAFCALVPLLSAALVLASSLPAKAALIFRLDASNIEIDNPAPLFSTGEVGGELMITDSVAPGSGFGLAQILGFSFNFGGIIVTLPETMLPGGDITAFGSRSADGASLSFFDLRFDLPPTVVSCSLVCAGQIQIGTFDRSNFVAIDDPNAATTSLLVFDAALVEVPEPGTLPLFGVALAGLLVMQRRRGWAVGIHPANPANAEG